MRIGAMDLNVQSIIFRILLCCICSISSIRVPSVVAFNVNFLDNLLSQNASIGASKMSRLDFANDFVFGAATAAYQIEGGAREGGRGPCLWDYFTLMQPDKINGGSNGNNAADSYHLYKEDVKILKKLGLDAYRLSFSWSRILPGGRINTGINKEGINYYNSVIDELLANDIKPFVTLMHWDTPQALEKEYGGFLSHNIVKDFAEYAELCFWEFGDRVKHWITFNEPSTYSEAGYASGVYAPGRGPTIGDPGVEPYLVTHHTLLAHSAAVEIYRNKFQRSQGGMIGMTVVSHWKEPLNNNEADMKAAQRARDFMYGWYMDPMTKGDYPDSMKRLVGNRLPKFTPQESKKLIGSLDFLGLNYYTAMYVTDDPNSRGPKLSYDTDALVRQVDEKNGKLIGPQAASSWLHIYPEGMEKLLVYTKQKYNISLIYITENGIDEPNNPNLTLSEARVDPFRIKNMQYHLYYIKQAINKGVNVKGYFAWSLLDNFEWNDGYSVRFGLVHVDYKDNFARYPKDSAIWLMNNFHRDLRKRPQERKA